MGETEEVKAPKPKLSDSEKEKKAYETLRELIAKQVAGEEKSENSKFLSSISKSAIKSFEGGKLGDWSKVKQDIAVFATNSDPTPEQIKKAISDLSLLALTKKSESETS